MLITTILIFFVALPLILAGISKGQAYTLMRDEMKIFTFKKKHDNILKLIEAMDLRAFTQPFVLVGSWVLTVFFYTLGIIVTGYTWYFIYAPLKFMLFKSNKETN